MLQDKNGQAVYEFLRLEDSPNLIGTDEDCTGKNDTTLSEQYYARGKGALKPSSTSTSLTPTAESATKTSAPASATPSASPSKAAAPLTGSEKSSAMHQVSLKSAFLVGMVLAPLFGVLV